MRVLSAQPIDITRAFLWKISVGQALKWRAVIIEVREVTMPKNVRNLSQLAFTKKSMKKMGYRVIDMIVEHHTSIRNKKVRNRYDGTTSDSFLSIPPPRVGESPERVLKIIEQHITRTLTHIDHPRYFAFIPGPAHYVGALADTIASGFNIFASTWFDAAAAAQIETTVIGWLTNLFGFDKQAGGCFTSGGSASNLSGLAVARQVMLGGRWEDATIYASDQTHACIRKGLRILGFPMDNFRELVSDSNCQLPVDLLRQAIQRDRKRGKRPVCVIANAGTTNTGAIDSIDSIANVCELEGLWLHVDGAFGSAAALSRQHQQAFRGLGRAHTLVINPHKWLFQPLDSSILIVRDAHWLIQTFSVSAEYLQTLETKDVNYFDRGIQLSRSFRALKFWMTAKILGLNAITKAIEHGIKLAEYAQSMAAKFPDVQVTSDAQLAIVTFRFFAKEMTEADIDCWNEGIAKTITDSGFAVVCTTKLKGKTVLRFCTIHPQTTRQDIDETIRRLVTIARQLKRTLAGEGLEPPTKGL
ncbi:MAG: hypothetical protein HY537_04810 [Deltaproteobacteria bacterium]|nr:hypothetical protein [Deltaproteobacteria bacterium]